MTQIPGRIRPRSLVLVAAVALAWGSAASASASPLGVRGTVIDATTHRPVPDQRVLLVAYAGETQVSSVAGRTDPQGSVSFDAPPSNATGFQLVTTYRGGTYRTPVTQTDGAAKPVTLKVYEPTTDPAAIAQTNWVVWIDPMPGGVVVQQDLTWTNDGTTAYIGPDQKGGVVTQVPLAPEARDVQVLGLYLNGGGRVRGAAYEGTQPIVPGTSTATVRYVVPSVGALNLTSPLATGNLHVFVADGSTVLAPGMTPGGQITDRGTDYQVFTAAGVAPGRSMAISLSPAPQTDVHAAPYVAAGVALLLLVAAIAVWRVRRRRRGRPPAASRTSPARVTASAADRASHASSAGPHGTEDAEDLLEEIAAIDIAFEEGLIAPDTYERLRTAAKDRLADAVASEPSA